MLEVKTNSVNIKKDNLKEINPTGILVLEDGTSFQGYGFGFEGITTGEVCFNTSITGYQEIITAPLASTLDCHLVNKDRSGHSKITEDLFFVITIKHRLPAVIFLLNFPS